jgi:hypothetical protein
MNYSIRYMNERGLTERSEFLPFETDNEAEEHSLLDGARHFIVEIWKGDILVNRTFSDLPAH